MNQSPSRRARRLLMPVFVPVLVCAGAALMVGAGVTSALVQRHMQDSQGWVIHSKSVQVSIATLRAQVDRARANARTYLLTGGPQSLRAFEQDRRSAATQVQALRHLVSDNPAQSGRVSVLGGAIDAAMSTYESELQQRSPPGDALLPWQRVQAAADDLDTAESRLLAQRLATLTATGNEGIVAIVGTVVVGLALLLAVAVLTKRLGEATVRQRVTAADAERLAAQAALSERDAEFRTLAENVSQLVWMARPDGRIYWYNRRWYDYTGTTPERMLGTPGWGWTDLHEPGEPQRVMQGFKAAIAAERDWEDTFALRSAAGTYRWFLSRALPVRDDHGRVIRWLGTHTDITEVRDAQAVLVEAARRKDEFLATLSHELRNPLAPIITAAELLGAPTLSADQLAWCGAVVRRQGHHLRTLVDDLLDASRISHGRLELRLERTGLRQVVDTAVDAALPAIRERGQQLLVDMAEPEPILLADPVRLAQVLSNLLNNACKFTGPQGDIGVRVRVDGGEVAIAVTDTGLGLSAADIGDVFEMFAQVRSTIDQSSGGLGIGLALSKGIVELHGGRIEALSAGPGMGSEFVVTLPLAAPQAAPQRGPAPVPAAGDGSPGPGRRVLLADDNRDAADSLAVMLCLSGHEVRVAYDGLEALALAEQHDFDVAVVDIGMPGLSGYEVAQRLRALPQGPQLELIALTGWGQEDDKRRARDAGFDGHMTKPADPDELIELVSSRKAAV